MHGAADGYSAGRMGKGGGSRRRTSGTSPNGGAARGCPPEARKARTRQKMPRCGARCRCLCFLLFPSSIPCFPLVEPTAAPRLVAPRSWSDRMDGGAGAPTRLPGVGWDDRWDGMGSRSAHVRACVLACVRARVCMGCAFARQQHGPLISGPRQGWLAASQRTREAPGGRRRKDTGQGGGPRRRRTGGAPSAGQRGSRSSTDDGGRPCRTPQGRPREGPPPPLPRVRSGVLCRWRGPQKVADP